jgi:hypothetical protein
MDSVIEARRARFEAWASEVMRAPLHRRDSLPLDDPRYGEYVHVHWEWLAYNAALDSLVIELPHIGDYLDLYRQGEDADAYLHDLFQAIEKTGVRVNG